MVAPIGPRLLVHPKTTREAERANPLTRTPSDAYVQRVDAPVALGSQQPAAPDIATLEQAVARGDADAARVLGQLETPEALAALARALADPRTPRYSAEEAARQLVNNASRLTADQKAVLLDRGLVAGGPREVEDYFRDAAASGDPDVIAALARSITPGNPSNTVRGNVLASAPVEALTPEAVAALGRAGVDSREAVAKLAEAAKQRVPGAAEQLTEIASRRNIVTQDDALNGLREAAIAGNGAALDRLFDLNERGLAEGSVTLQGVNVLYTTIGSLPNPGPALDRLRASGQIDDFVYFHTSSRNAPGLADDSTRAAVISAVEGPPPHPELRSQVAYALSQTQAYLGDTNTGAQLQQDLARAAETFAAELQATAQNDPKLRELLDLSRLLYRAQQDPGLAARLDMDALRARIGELSADPEVVGTMQRLREQSDIMGVGRRLEERMASPLYADRLRMMEPEERMRTLSADLQQLAQVDPAAAQRVAQQLAGEAITQDPMAAIAAMSPEERRAALEQIVAATGGSVTALSDAIELALEARAKGLPVPPLDQLLAALPEAARGPVQDFFSRFQGGMQGLSFAMSAVSLGAAAASGDVLGMLRGTLGVASSADVFGQLFSRTVHPPEWLKGMSRQAGAAGMFWNAFDEAMQAGSDLRAGDWAGAIANTTSGAGYALIAGSLLTGPAAGGTALVGLGLVLAGEVGDALFGQSSDEELARRYGIWK